MVSKVNLKKRAESKKEVFVFLFLILSFGLLVSFMMTIRQSQAEKTTEVESRTLAQTTEVDANATLSTSPTGTPSPFPESISITPTPSLTTTPQTGQIQEQVEQAFDEIAAAVSYYSGPPLPGPSEKKELLIISDSLPQEPWRVEREDFEWVQGKLGRGIAVQDGGSLILSGGEVFVSSGTLSFWLRIESEPSWIEAPIIAWNFDGQNQQFSLFELSIVEDILQFNLYEEGGNQDDIHASITRNQWQHITVTWDLTNQPYKRVIYIDGKKLAEGGFPFAPVTNFSSVFKVGGSEARRTSARFIIDEIALTNWAKREEEIVE